MHLMFQETTLKVLHSWWIRSTCGVLCGGRRWDRESGLGSIWCCARAYRECRNSSRQIIRVNE